VEEGTMGARLEAWDGLRQGERDLAAARGEPYAQVIDIGPRWEVGAPQPHLISNGSRAFIVCRGDQPPPGWDGTSLTMVSPASTEPSPVVVIELSGCQEIRLGIGPGDHGVWRSAGPACLPPRLTSHARSDAASIMAEGRRDRNLSLPWRALLISVLRPRLSCHLACEGLKHCVGICQLTRNEDLAAGRVAGTGGHLLRPSRGSRA
jgi:hypothetical protein